ncbi:MAG: hypothetical protein COZ75_13145 [Flavobacteriaceae bacterium CG_4_8_14_3_um_filter_34_10]|nr:hypothetical protein [Flavobacteriia bacterium]PIV49773.1 MAG: hypothetical protein COS19_06920 [Flavobacteriaceae bacterium CG02_land_8_20_14_3_00_34_13]PIX08239.1 MAG: hypothetical protein COZ75_13145 [Flavobacteriaceae bacterium CG_4_8_14_3_um_filter_34_10]PIZ07914.1 MAG: hypothetical protein COY56_06605 [Flavobacteriaceae bacterium CG_4_10_14_0_8_um_filter_34_31]
MRNKIFMYLFIFSVLMLLFMYINQKKIYENQEEKIEILKEKVTTSESELKIVEAENSNLNYFSLQGNENAMSYFENLGYEADQIENLVTEQIYKQNTTEGSNPLVPYEGMASFMKINKVRFLNHKWLIADFTDGTYWGEMLIQFDLNEKKEITLNTIGSLLYPSN